MTGAELMTVVGFIVMLIGAIASVWWRVESKIVKNSDDLAAHKLHCSEVFATKQGMQEQTSQLLRAIEGVGNRIDSMNERLDRAFEQRPASRRAS